MDHIEGLPEGLELIRFGVPRQEDGEALFSNGKVVVCPIVYHAGAVVRCLPGYAFVFDAPSGEWLIEHRFATARTVHVVFSAMSVAEYERIERFVKNSGINAEIV